MFFSLIKDKKTLKQGLQVRCRELDIFNQFFLEIVWKFFGFFGEVFEFFREDFLGRNSLLKYMLKSAKLFESEKD